MVGFEFGFTVMPILFSLVFLAVMGIFVFVAVKGISEWNSNNKSPRLTVDATVVAKRTNVSRSHHHHGADHMMHTSTSTTYYVTFQVASGDRMELHVAGHRYGLMVEGDKGRLTFQGTRFLDFERGV